MKAGWLTKPLGDTCDWQRGLTYSKADEVEVSENIVLRATNIDLATNLLDLGELKYINEKVIVPDSKKVKVGSLMICTASGSKSHLGKVAYIDDDYGYAFGGFMGMLTPKNELNSKFLFHLMTSPAYKDFIAALSDGANINNLKFDDLRQFVIPVPPLPEQQRIVTLLDEAFDGIATARAHAEKNLQNARAIFESHLQSVFTDKAKEWPDCLLGDVFHIGSSKRIYETDWTTEGVPFFGGREIVKLAKFGSVESASFISEEKYQEYASKYEMPQANDILMTARGTIGVGYIVKPGDKFYYKDGNVISLRAKNPSNPQFVLYAFRSNAILNQLTVLVGTTVSHLPIEKAKMLKICMPTFEVQNFIVEHLEMMETHSRGLESIYQQKITALDALKKSLLHRAFNGDL